MKLHELDWQEVLEALPRWEALSPAARRAFIGIRPGQGFTLESLDGGAELRDAGLLVAPTGRGTLYALDSRLRPLLIALRAADRLAPLSEPALRQAYLDDQMNSLQALRIAAPGRGYYEPRDRKLAAEVVSSVAWLRGFLAAGSHAEMMKWEEARMTAEDRPRLVFPAVAAALRALVTELARHPRGVPLSKIRELVPETSPHNLTAALAAGLRYLLVFVSMRRDASVVVGLLPGVAVRAAGPLPPPGPVQAGEVFAAPFRVGDMVAVLVEAATEPIALRAADRSMYVRSQRAIAARLATAPSWVERFASTGYPLITGKAGAGEGDSADATKRIESAAELASLLRLARVESSGGRLQYASTRSGRAWLNVGAGERLKAVLSALRALSQRVPSAHGSAGGPDFFGAPLGFAVDGAKIDLRDALSAAFLSVPAGEMVSATDFIHYHARERNPFLGAEGPLLPASHYWRGTPHTVEGWENAWGGMLLGFLASRLVPLGCATLAQAGKHDVAFGLTDAGRYLLGEAEDFEIPAEPGGGDVVVQPDFEVVFLAPAPHAEAELGRMAERTGSGVGAIFRLTRASIFRAAEQGMSADQVLDTLRSASRGEIPANVLRQVRDWVQSARTVHIAPAVLINCPDAETAARVRALGGAHVTPVSPTLLRLDGDAKMHAALVKRLRERGIFVAST
ncbi:MAG TPA: helicase-associated domain-containing protein [Longimicrobium sp.]